jgi:hypothetical protein
VAFRQFEVSDTCVFDRPEAGRMWFEGVIRDHLAYVCHGKHALDVGPTGSNRAHFPSSSQSLDPGVLFVFACSTQE